VSDDGISVHDKEGNSMDEMEKLLSILHDVDEDVDFRNINTLVDDGHIDSFDITMIIAALDMAYDIHIEVGDIEPENFNSAKAILETVKRYQKLR
jgi:acyl carrier protein